MAVSNFRHLSLEYPVLQKEYDFFKEIGEVRKDQHYLYHARNNQERGIEIASCYTAAGRTLVGRIPSILHVTAKGKLGCIFHKF
jgi:hypothetical protein